MFKNVTPYLLLESFTHSPEALEQMLAAHVFNPCEPLDMQSRGWVAPLGAEGQQLVHVSNGCYLLALREESKILPPAVVSELLAERVAEREEQECRKVRRREREQMKEELFFELLPRAFSRSKVTLGYIDTVNGWLVVDASTWRQAEAFTEFLRECLGSLPIAPPATRDAPQSVMTEWLASDALPADMELGEEAVFEDPQTEGCEIRAKRQDLQAEEIKAHIKSGKRIRRLAVGVADRLSCVLDADYAIRRLKFSDVVLDPGLDDGGELTFAERFDADFTLISLEIATLLKRVMELWGGLASKVEPGAEPSLAGCSLEADGLPVIAWDGQGNRIDPLYEKAAKEVTASGVASPSRLQRVLGVGYNRACQLLELMEAKGIVGPLDDQGARAVLVKGEAA